MTLYDLWHENGKVKPANIVTLSRALLILPIAGLLQQHQSFVALAVYFGAIATDGLDGWLARKYGQMSERGAILDAVVDNIFSVAIALFLWLSLPEIFIAHLLAFAFIFIVPLLYLAVSYVWTGNVLMFHFHSAKLGALLLFLLWPVLELTGYEIVIPLTAIVLGVSRLEQIIFIIRGGRDQDAAHFLVDIYVADEVVLDEMRLPL